MGMVTKTYCKRCDKLFARETKYQKCCDLCRYEALKNRDCKKWKDKDHALYGRKSYFDKWVADNNIKLEKLRFK